MSQNKHSSHVFFLIFSAAVGFLLALGYYNFFLQDKQSQVNTDTTQKNSPELTIPIQTKTTSLSRGITSFAPAVNRAAPAVVNIFTRKRIKQQKKLNSNATLRALLENRPPPSSYKEENNLGP